MKFVILFEDDAAASPDIRATHMPEHLAFLEANADSIEAAGPVLDPSGKGRGGIWVLEAESVREVERLVHEDPFWTTGLRKSFEILVWKQVFSGGTRLIRP